VGVFVLPVFPALPLVGVSRCVLREAIAATGDLATFERRGANRLHTIVGMTIVATAFLLYAVFFR